jgi:hypothetical protein
MKELLGIMTDEVERGELLEAAESTKYQAGVGELNWLAQTTHPDLSVAVSLLGSFNSHPPASGLKAIKHAMRYVAGTVGQRLKTNRNPTQGLFVASDSDWAGMHSHMKTTRSRGGFVATYAGMPVAYKTFWESERLSSAEAELFAASEAAKMGLHLQYVAEELFGLPATEVIVYVDSSAAIAHATNTSSPGRMKHIDQRDNWLRLLKDTTRLRLEKIPGTVNPADFLTKLFGAAEFQEKKQFYISGASE